MPKTGKNKKMKKGGFFDFKKYTEQAKDWNPFAKKESTIPYVPPSTTPVEPGSPVVAPVAATPAPTVMNTPVHSDINTALTATPGVGGRRKSRRRRSRKHKKQRGGVHPSETSSHLALNAMPFSGKTAEPQVWLGGKTRKRRKNKRRSKSHKKRKY